MVITIMKIVARNNYYQCFIREERGLGERRGNRTQDVCFSYREEIWLKNIIIHYVSINIVRCDTRKGDKLTCYSGLSLQHASDVKRSC